MGMITDKQEDDFIQLLEVIKKKFISRFGENAWWKLWTTYDDFHYTYVAALDRITE